MMKLLLFPFNGNAREAVSCVERINREDNNIKLNGFIDDDKSLTGKQFANYPVLGTRKILSDYPSTRVLAIPGRPDNHLQREKVISSLGLEKEKFTTLIHPSAQLGSEVKVGYNSLIMAGVVLTANVTIGNHCIVMPGTVISHECVIEDYCMIGSNVSISGGVQVGRLSYIGAGAKIIQEVSIGEKSMVGIGSVVLKSTDPESVVVGNPATLLKKD